jgi:hypothetical protein
MLQLVPLPEEKETLEAYLKKQRARKKKKDEGEPDEGTDEGVKA